jgi:hypothetical protein
MIFGTGDYRRDTEKKRGGNAQQRRGNSQMGRILPEGLWCEG